MAATHRRQADGTPLRLSWWAWLLLAAAAIAAVTLVFVTIDPHFPAIGIFAGSADLHVYAAGGEHVRDSISLYSGKILDGHLYTYTPFSAVLFVPLTYFPAEHLDKLVMLVNMVVLTAVVALSWRLLGKAWSRQLIVASALFAAACTFTEPIRTTLFYGQINLILMLLVLWDLSRPDGSRLRGIGIGIAAGIKLTPIYFVAHAVAVGKWRTGVRAVLVAAATVIVGAAVIPRDSWTYWTDKFFETNRVSFPNHPANQSIHGFLNHLVWNAHGRPYFDKPASDLLWLAIAVPTALIALWTARRLYQRGDVLFSIALSGLTACAVSPFSWSHHWVWFVPLMVMVFDRAIADRGSADQGLADQGSADQGTADQAADDRGLDDQALGDRVPASDGGRRAGRWNPAWLLVLAAIYGATIAWPHEWNANFAVVGLFHLWPFWFPVVDIYVYVYFAVLAWACVSAFGPGIRARRQQRPPRLPDDRTADRTHTSTAV